MIRADETYQRALAVLDNLPQALHARPQQQAWLTQMLDRIAHTDPGENGLTLDRYLQRLPGFGASEIGILVGERRGQYSPFKTAREIVAEKLLQQIPPPVQGHQRRGITLEPLVRAEFLRHSGAVRCEHLTGQVAAHHPEAWPWMLATPDDLVTVNGVLVVVDYKAPAEPLTEISLAYACQLHQIALLAEDLGHPIGGLALVAWNHKTWSPEVWMCPRDPALEQEIIAAGNYYWRHHVLAGELPPWPTPHLPGALTLADLNAQAKADIEQAAARLLRLDILAREAKAMADTARDQLESQCRAHRLPETVMSGALKITAQPTWDLQAIEARLPEAHRATCQAEQWDVATLVKLVRQLGGDPAAAQIATPRIDPDRAARWLIEHTGIPPDQLRNTDYRISVSRRKADQALLAPVRDAAGSTIHHFGQLGAPAP